MGTFGPVSMPDLFRGFGDYNSHGSWLCVDSFCHLIITHAGRTVKMTALPRQCMVFKMASDTHAHFRGAFASIIFDSPKNDTCAAPAGE
jgi:hypothetical protein